MKTANLLKASLVMLLCLGVSGCGSSDNDNKEKTSEKKETKQKEYGLKDKVDLGKQTLTVTKVSTSKGSDFATPKKGNVFVLIDVTIQNTSDEEIDYNALYFSVQNPEGQIDETGFSMLDVPHPLNSGKLAPNGKVSGTLVVEEAKSHVKDLILLYEKPWDEKKVQIHLK